MKNALLLLLLFCSLTAISQTEDVLYEYAKGKKYIVHYAQAGNTLWGLHTTYNVPVDDIVAANPGISKGVQEGNKYLIPIGTAETKYPDGTQMLLHTAVKGDTPYSLAKKHNVTPEELTKLNPELATGLKLGQQVKIPVKKLAEETTANPVVVEQAQKTPLKTTVSFSDTVIAYTVKDNETLYSISKRFMVPVSDLLAFNNMKTNKIKEGDVLQIPLKKESIKQVEVRPVTSVTDDRQVDEELLFKKKEKYHIAVLLPFDLDSKGSNSLKTVATEFYMGIELAVDSLEKLGFEAVVNVVDFPSDSAQIMAELKKGTLKNMDLIFGPLLPQNADLVGNWCKSNKIRMVCPSAVNSSMLKNNPYVYAAVSSDITQQRILAKYTLENFSHDQLVLVNSGVAKDKELYDAFRSRFMELAKSKGNLKLIEIKIADLATYIRKNGNTVFVVPTRDKVSATKFMNALHKSSAKAGNGSITVLGTKEWSGFDDISGFMKSKYNVHWASSTDLNYTLPETKRLLYLYRGKFKADMNKASVQAFDVLYYFASTLLMGQEVANEVANDFKMEKVAEGSGFENSQCFILKHQDYELIRVGVFHE